MSESIQAYTMQQLAALYGVSVKVMRRWLKEQVPELGARTGHYYTIRQVTLVFHYLGAPAANAGKALREAPVA